MSLNLEQAKRIVEAGVQEAVKMQIRISVAVVDGHGDLIAFARMDGARTLTVNVAQGKALASSMWGLPSGDLVTRGSGPIGQMLIVQSGGRIAFGQGAVPILDGSTVLGACGVSGGTGEEDEVVAKIAIGKADVDQA